MIWPTKSYKINDDNDDRNGEEVIIQVSKNKDFI